jgi:hypothetical protein
MAVRGDPFTADFLVRKLLCVSTTAPPYPCFLRLKERLTKRRRSLLPRMRPLTAGANWDICWTGLKQSLHLTWRAGDLVCDKPESLRCNVSRKDSDRNH